eukprot:CAMPEP_0174260486 /NCGR_PEP_ID=MMETSP0439-20130205/9733_1 /TAXON_ID=0 /ORGANISM="Stereomyxa ramosa, Strain Chinc5" /LENGTH=1700 /DNA_ID=CAMNT_0015344737 /DNA_START=141 /DNA_END=5243 /DNA_ORIENTATION=+
MRMLKTFVVLILALGFTTVVECGLVDNIIECIADPSRTVNGAEWDDISWDCEEVDQFKPGFNDHAILRNISVVLSTTQQIDRLTLTAGSALLIEGGFLETRVIEMEFYSVMEVDTADELLITNNNVSETNNTYIRLDCSSLSIGDGEFVFATQGEFKNDVYIQLTTSTFTKTGAGNVVLATGPKTTSVASQLVGIVGFVATTGSVVSIPYSFHIINYGSNTTSGFLARLQTYLEVEHSELEVGGDVWLVGGDSTEYRGGYAYALFYGSTIQVYGDLLLTGGNGAYADSPGIVAETTASRSGGAAYFFARTSEVTVSSLVLTGGPGGHSSDASLQGYGGAAVAYAMSSSVYIGAAFNLTGGTGGFYTSPASPGAGGGAIVIIQESSLFLTDSLYFTGGDAGDGYYYAYRYCYYCVGGEATLLFRSANMEVLTQLEENTVDVGLFGRAGRGSYNAFYFGTDYGSPDGGDCYISVSLSTFVFRDADISCIAGNGGDNYYSPPANITDSGYGGSAYLHISENSQLVIEDITVSLIAGRAGYAYAQSGPGIFGYAVGGSAGLSIRDSQVSFSYYTALNFVPGVGRSGPLGSGGASFVRILTSSVIFENELNIYGAGSGYDNSQVYDSDRYKGGEAVLFLSQNPLVVFDQGVTIKGGDGTALDGDLYYAGYGGEAVFLCETSDVWMNDDLTVQGGRGGDSYYTPGRGGDAEFYAYSSRIYFQGVDLIGGRAGNGERYTSGSTGSYGGDCIFSSEYSVLSFSSLTATGGTGAYASLAYFDLGLFVVGGNGGSARMTFYGSKIWVDTYLQLTGGLGGNGRDLGGYGGEAYVYVSASEFYVGSSTLLTGGLSSLSYYTANPGGDCEVVIRHSVAILSDVSLLGGDAGDTFPYSADIEGNAGFNTGGASLLRVAYSFLQMGYVSLQGGNGGSSADYDSYGHGGDGGAALLYLHKVFNAIEGEDLISGFVSIVGGDGGDAYYYYEGISGGPGVFHSGGDGGYAFFWATYILPRADISSWVSLVGGDGGFTVHQSEYVGEGGEAYFYSHVASISVGSYLSVVGGTGGASTNYNGGGNAATSAVGGGAFVTFQKCVDGVNVSESIEIRGGDGGYMYGPIYIPGKDSVSGNGGDTIFSVKYCRFCDIGGDITMVSGSTADASSPGLTQFTLWEVLDSSMFILGSVSLTGGDTGEAYLSGERGGGAVTIQITETSQVEIAQELTSTGGSAGSSYKQTSAPGYTTLLVDCSLLRIGGNVDITSGAFGDCTATTGTIFYSSTAETPNTFTLINSIVNLGEYLTISNNDGAPGCAYTLFVGSSYSAQLYISGSEFTVDKDITIISGNAGSNEFAVGGDAYLPRITVRDGSFVSARTISLTNPEAGDSYGSFYGSDLIFSDALPQIFFGYNSDLNLRGDLTIQGGITGASENSYSGQALSPSPFLSFDSHSFGLVQGNIFISSFDEGDSLSNNRSDNTIDAEVAISRVSGLTVWGDFTLLGGDGSTGAYRSDGGNAFVSLSECSQAWFQGETTISAGYASDGFGDGGDASIYLSLSSMSVNTVTLTPGGGGDDDGRAAIWADAHSDFSVGGAVELVGDDSLLLQRHSTFIIYPCEDADLIIDETGTNLHLWFSEFFDCRSDEEEADLNYVDPTGDDSSDFDCTPCSCDFLETSDIEDICALASPSPSSDPSPPDSDSIPDSASALSMHLISFLKHLLQM